MKVKRSLLFTALAVVLAICSGMLLSGCASTPEATDAGPEMGSPQAAGEGQGTGVAVESPPRIENLTTAPEATSGINPEARKAPVINTGGSGAKPRVQQATPKAGANTSEHLASHTNQELEPILTETAEETVFDRIASALGAIVLLWLIWRVAFWLARLPRRRREAVLRTRDRHVGAHAGVLAAQ